MIQRDVEFGGAAQAQIERHLVDDDAIQTHGRGDGAKDVADVIREGHPIRRMRSIPPVHLLARPQTENEKQNLCVSSWHVCCVKSQQPDLSDPERS